MAYLEDYDDDDSQSCSQFDYILESLTTLL